MYCAAVGAGVTRGQHRWLLLPAAQCAVLLLMSVPWKL